jgi:hypothetical protein
MDNDTNGGGVAIESTPLLACPFCGNKDITLWPMRGFKSPLCEQCGATICEACMTGDDTAKQIASWNTRHANKELSTRSVQP